jgi:NAD(P)-dependent dehydrogenase (short-subunit alcohol dehydrogenase family)
MAQAPHRLDPFDLTGKVAVVTGGSRGLGRHMAFGFADHGAAVVVASRNREPCLEVAREITDVTGSRALGVACHVGRWSDCDALVARVLDEFGSIDVLVNNAGMSPLYDSLDAVSEELFDKVLAVNLKGAFRLTALCGTAMAKRSGGSIINISSIAAVRPTSAEVPYAAAKAALNNLTIATARSFGPTVRVNAIMPGPFLTDISGAWDLDDFARTAANEIPAGRGGRPDEIVGAALYLASSASSFTNGAVLKIDGGWAHSPA